MVTRSAPTHTITTSVSLVATTSVHPSSTRASIVTTTTLFVPVVDSPFTPGELAFLNAWAVTSGDLERFFGDGVDTDTYGRVGRGWNDLELLEPYLNRVHYGHLLCDNERAESWMRDGRPEQRDRRQEFVLTAGGWLC